MAVAEEPARRDPDIRARIVGALALLLLIGTCFGSVLVGGRQFVYRDAGHFYYPLYQRVQEEWRAHRWPLWDPRENAGMPLLGNPTAAVLYPGKLLYGLFSYPWATRLYAVAHVALAFGGMLAFGRSLGISRTGSFLAGLSYAFGAPVLFQYCNIIYLVGAAWAPLGLRAADRWLRLGRRWGLIELALVIAMQTLGGDLETAYLTGFAAVGYAFGLSRRSARGADDEPGRGDRWRRWAVRVGMMAGFVAWVILTLAVGRLARRGLLRYGTPAPWVVQPLVWSMLGLWILRRGREGRARSLPARGLLGLAGAGVVAGALAAVQLVPVLEFTGQTSRISPDGPHEVYAFSLEPYRVLELLWPNVYGTALGENRHWLSILPPRTSHDIWVPSLYLGLPTVLLAGLALTGRGGPAWRGWLVGLMAISLAASLGKFGGPLWWARDTRAGAAWVGPHDPVDRTLRADGCLRDGDGSVYGLLTLILPGFQTFRYPSKLLSITALAVAALAGLGWDRLARAGRRGAWVPLALAVASLAALGATIGGRARLIDVFDRAAAQVTSIFGPLQAAGAVADLQGALAQGALVSLAACAVVRLARAGSRWAGPLALGLLALDLAGANARLVVTLPQADLDRVPRAIEILRRAEAEDPEPGLFRIHRMPQWEPTTWLRTGAPDRYRTVVAWERDTLQPKYGLPYGLSYTLTKGTAELYDYEFFFGPFPRPLSASQAATLRQVTRQPVARRGTSPDRFEVVYFPRRSFDLWNTRYFLIPANARGFDDERHGYAAFVPDTERVYPGPERFHGADIQERARDWFASEDFQILRNRAAFPRAWLVHDARRLKPIVGMRRADRQGPMQQILYQDDEFWSDPRLRAEDPHLLAWIETGDWPALRPFLPRTPPETGESVTITRYEPQRVELTAVLKRPGIVVLADVFYPGWRLTIDGRPAPILRTNRMMRGAAVPDGRHRLVYTYDPESFRLGALGSLVGGIALLTLGLWAARQDRAPVPP